MLDLLAVSVVWAFSFGIIKHELPNLAPAAVGVVRLVLAAAVLLPAWRPRALPRTGALWLVAVGALQFGVMYVLYLRAFAYLQAYEIALATILTPVYVVLLDSAIDNRFRPRHVLAAVMAVLGAGVLVWRRASSEGDAIMVGFLLMQLSNLCFAAGQVAYRRTRPGLPPGMTDAAVFAWLYLGGIAVTAAVSSFGTDWGGFHPTDRQMLWLLVLGTVASGLGFYGWNLGATRVNAGTLAVFNNAKVPLGVAASLLCFGEKANLTRLGLSFALLGAAVWVAGRERPVPPDPAPADQPA